MDFADYIIAQEILRGPHKKMSKETERMWTIILGILMLFVLVPIVGGLIYVLCL